MMDSDSSASAAMAPGATGNLRLDAGMPTPPRLIGQIAAEATAASGKRVTEHQVRQAMYAQGLASTGRELDQAARAMRLKRRTLQRLARRWIIDFADYRPFRGDACRPAPIGRLDPPAALSNPDAPAVASAGVSDKRPIGHGSGLQRHATGEPA